MKLARISSDDDDDCIVKVKSSEDSDNDEQDEASEEDKRSNGEEEEIELFVGNLAFITSEGSIRTAFSKFGEIKNIKMPTDPMGKPKGFAFVQYSKFKNAKKACEALNGQDLDGRNIRVNFTSIQQVASATKKNFAASRIGALTSGNFRDADTVFVGNLGFKT
jgi:nucleolin